MSSEAIKIVETLATRLVDFLEDERRPKERFCPICLLSFPQLLAQGGEAAIPNLQTQHHGFLDTCMRNLSVRLTATETVALRRRLQNNIARCRMVKDKSHSDLLRAADYSHIDDPLALLHSMLSGVLVSCLYGFDRKSDRPFAPPPVNRAENSHKPFRSARGLWPTSVNQLFPYGPERTVESIIECCCSFADRNALILLAALLELVRPRIWELVLQPTNLHRLSWAISTTLLLGIPGCYESLSPDSRFTPPGCKVPARWKEAEWLQDGKGMQAAATLLFTLRRGNYAHPDDGLRFCGPHGELLRPAIRAALDYCGTNGLDVDADRTFAYYLANMQRGAQMRVLRPLITDAELERAVERNPRDRAVWDVLWLAMSWLVMDRRCAGPQCARTMLDRFDEEDKPLSTCARCRLMRYCSKTCQQSDWKAGQPVSHKLLCPILSKLHDIGKLDATEEVLCVLMIQRSGLSDEQLASAGKWALSRGQVMRDHLAQCVVAFSTPTAGYR